MATEDARLSGQVSLVLPRGSIHIANDNVRSHEQSRPATHAAF
jgi:hypothetical protein